MDTYDVLRAKRTDEAETAVKRSGYERGGRLKQEDDAAKDKRMARKRGGKVEGEAAAPRLDKRARGGAMPGQAEPRPAAGGGKKGGRSKPAVNVNIISQGAAQGEKQQAAKAGLQAGVRLGAASAVKSMGGGGGPPPGAAPGGPGGPPPPPPPNAPPMAAPDQPPMRRGGRTGKK